MIFWVFVGEMGKTIFGSGDKARSLQYSSWGEVGNSLDAFYLGHMDRSEWKGAEEGKEELVSSPNR